jgi:hypothetical protein
MSELERHVGTKQESNMELYNDNEPTHVTIHSEYGDTRELSNVVQIELDNGIIVLVTLASVMTLDASLYSITFDHNYTSEGNKMPEGATLQ